MKGHLNKASSQKFSVDLASVLSWTRLCFFHHWDEHLRLLVCPCQFQTRLIHILLQSPTRSSFLTLVVDPTYTEGSFFFQRACVTMPRI